jgi:thioredoxin reductase (NADPH)
VPCRHGDARSEHVSAQETADNEGAYPRLSEAQIAALDARGRRRATKAGEVLYREGDTGVDFIVIVAGAVAVVDGSGDRERELGVHGPRRFLGELGLLTGQPSFTGAVVREAGEVLEVPVEELRKLVAGDPELGDLLLRAFLSRRWMLIGLGAGLRVVGSRYSTDLRRLREFLARNRIPHAWVDLERDQSAEALLRDLGVAPDDTPIVIWRGERVLRNPSNAELARVLGLAAPRAVEMACDLVVIGAGPAGLAAAVYGASEGLATVVLDAVAPGGQAATTSRIENYLGFPSGISGSELAERATIQAEKFGARLTVPARAAALESDDGRHRIRLDDGSDLLTRTVMIATGKRYRRLPVPRLEEFEGASVYYAATQVEAQLCAGDPVAVVGGGNSAGQAAEFLSRQVTEVHLVVREAALTECMSRYLSSRIERNPKIDVLLETEIRELEGDDVLEAIVAENTATGERRRIAARALFIFIGAEPQTGWLHSGLALDDGGYIVTGPDAGGRSLLETSRPGVFAAGDVRSGSVSRVASAVGEGAMAVRLIFDALDEDGGRAQT